MVAQRKPELDQTPAERDASASAERSPADARQQAGSASPARALQAQLHSEFAARDVPLSRPQMLAMFIVFSLAAWWAVYLLVTGLAAAIL